MRPSTPAVLRPALTSVTRRTLTRALLRDRSISFCRLRTFFRSPACDAAKIRRLSRRTFSSAWPQSTESQPGLVLRSVHQHRCPTCPSVMASLLLLSAGSPGPRQRSFEPGTRPIRPVMREPLAGEPASGPGFLLPFGHRHSLLGPSCARWGIGPSSRSAYRRTTAGPHRGCHVPHVTDAAGVGVL